MIFGKHINRYYFRYAHWLILGLLSLVTVDSMQLVIPKFYRMIINGMNGGMVEVKLQKLNRGVELRFSNSTDGVEKGSLDRWFDRFYRTDLSRNSSTGGSGIGLSVVKAIVNAHGGNVKAFSADGKVVEFTINI